LVVLASPLTIEAYDIFFITDFFLLLLLLLLILSSSSFIFTTDNLSPILFSCLSSIIQYINIIIIFIINNIKILKLLNINKNNALDKNYLIRYNQFYFFIII